MKKMIPKMTKIYSVFFIFVFLANSFVFAKAEDTGVTDADLRKIHIQFYNVYNAIAYFTKAKNLQQEPNSMQLAKHFLNLFSNYPFVIFQKRYQEIITGHPDSIMNPLGTEFINAINEKGYLPKDAAIEMIASFAQFPHQAAEILKSKELGVTTFLNLAFTTIYHRFFSKQHTDLMTEYLENAAVIKDALPSLHDDNLIRVISNVYEFANLQLYLLQYIQNNPSSKAGELSIGIIGSVEGVKKTIQAMSTTTVNGVPRINIKQRDTLIRALHDRSVEEINLQVFAKSTSNLISLLFGFSELE